MKTERNPYYPLKTGTKVLVTIEATIVEVETRHGFCYEVLLPQKDYNLPRKIWVDADEIKEIE